MEKFSLDKGYIKLLKNRKTNDNQTLDLEKPRNGTLMQQVDLRLRFKTIAFFLSENDTVAVKLV